DALLLVVLFDVAQLTAVGAQAVAQLALFLIQVIGGPGLAYAQAGQRLGSGQLGDVTRLDDGGFQHAAQGFIQGLAMYGLAHQKVTGPSFSLLRICCFTSASQASTSASLSKVLRGRLMRCSLGCSSSAASRRALSNLLARDSVRSTHCSRLTSLRLSIMASASLSAGCSKVSSLRLSRMLFCCSALSCCQWLSVCNWARQAAWRSR